jgi:hypothetical protein
MGVSSAMTHHRRRMNDFRPALGLLPGRRDFPARPFAERRPLDEARPDLVGADGPEACLGAYLSPRGVDERSRVTVPQMLAMGCAPKHDRSL